MRIVAYPVFKHAGSLMGSFDSRDPRRSDFSESHVEVDLRRCEFIQPAAVLWCVLYPLLALERGATCEILVPENLGVCIYLRTLGVIELLKDNGVSIDDRDIPQRDAEQLIVPLTRFDTESDVEQAANQAEEALMDSGLGSANLYPVVSNTFAELAMNAVQHSQSEIGAYGFIQFYESERGRRFVCGVADGGIGIRRSLESNPEHRGKVPYDWIAIEHAVKERVSGTGDQHRGIGLFGIAEEMRKADRQLYIHSGIGVLRTSEDMQSEARRTRLLPGTLGYASIPA